MPGQRPHVSGFMLPPSRTRITSCRTATTVPAFDMVGGRSQLCLVASMGMSMLMTSQAWVTGPVAFSGGLALCRSYAKTRGGDQKMASGRARQQVTMALDPSNLWDSYLGALESTPLLTKAVTAGILLPGADFTAQLIERTKAKTDDTEVPPLDLARTARFAIFGFALQAPWNHFYYLVLDQLIPPSPDPLSATTAAKVAIDQFVQAPIFTVIIFAFLGLLEGKSTDEIKGKLDADYKSTMVSNWKLWVPATMINMALIPPVLRVGFVNMVFFGWSIFLSLVVNKKKEPSS